MKKNLCYYCKNATFDCCEYYGGSKEWFVDGCEKDADCEAEIWAAKKKKEAEDNDKT